MSTYKAVRLTKLSKTFEEGIDNLTIEELPRQPLKDKQVRVAVHASCLNYFDLLILVGRYQYKPKLPFTMGSEGSGVVIEVGPGVKKLKVGDSVIQAMGVSGAMASEFVENENNLIPKPASLSHSHAAALAVGFFTGYHALVQRGRLQKGETVLITGAGGGMGLSAVQISKALGAIVIAACSTAEKAAIAKQYGADHTVIYGNNKNWKKEVDTITQNKGVNVVYEVVGGDVFDTSFRCLTSGGGARLLVVGFACGRIPSIPANLVLVKGIEVIGVRSGAEMMINPQLTREMTLKMHEWVEKKSNHSIIPHVTEYGSSIEEVKHAYTELNKAKVLGKVAIVWRKQAGNQINNEVHTSKL